MATLSDYSYLIESFLLSGYQSVFFDRTHESKCLVLRHDIDYDCNYALKMAETEREMGVRATYFFMLGSGFYNLFSKNNLKCVNKILELGHRISVHFDPVAYSDIDQGLSFEIELFKNRFNLSEISIVSLHEPDRLFFGSVNKIGGVDHAYMPKYVNEMQYIADSRGYFKYGNPLQCKAFQDGKNIQLLIHPIWWVVGMDERIKVLQKFIALKDAAVKSEIPFFYFDDSDLVDLSKIGVAACSLVSSD